MTGVADTRLLLALEFPSSVEVKRKIGNFLEKEISQNLLAPCIVLTEFVEIAGARIGVEAVQTRIRLLKDKGLRIAEINEREALEAGSLLLFNRDVSTADALIAAFVKCGLADYVLTDDPHFKKLGVKTKWF
ncbi:MAG: PIN domain-containing protein [Candidatus Bathyarchaeia archaeon]